MKKSLFFAVVIALLAVNPLAMAAEKADYLVTFQGEGLVAAVPDQTVLSLTVTETQKSMRAALANHSTRMTKLLSVLEQVGAQKKNIRTAYLNYRPAYEYDRQIQKQVRVGYTVSQGLTVKLDIAAGPALLESLGENQLADVNGFSFVVSNADELREKAVKLAIEDAKAVAARRASQAGMTLGQVVGYSEAGYSRQEPQVREMAMGAAKSLDAPPPSLPAGESEIRASVTLTYKVLVPVPGS